MFHSAMERLEAEPRMSTETKRQRMCPPLRIVGAIAAAVTALSLAAASPALADTPIQNPFFKDTSASGANSGTDLSGWGTSAPGQVINTW